MAIVYNKLGQLDEREEAAHSFRRHITAYENPQDIDDSSLFSILSSKSWFPEIYVDIIEEPGLHRKITNFVLKAYYLA